MLIVKTPDFNSPRKFSGIWTVMSFPIGPVWSKEFKTSSRKGARLPLIVTWKLLIHIGDWKSSTNIWRIADFTFVSPRSYQMVMNSACCPDGSWWTYIRLRLPGDGHHSLFRNHDLVGSRRVVLIGLPGVSGTGAESPENTSKPSGQPNPRLSISPTTNTSSASSGVLLPNCAASFA